MLIEEFRSELAKADTAPLTRVVLNNGAEVLDIYRDQAEVVIVGEGLDDVPDDGWDPEECDHDHVDDADLTALILAVEKRLERQRSFAPPKAPEVVALFTAAEAMVERYKALERMIAETNERTLAEREAIRNAKPVDTGGAL